MKLNGFKDFSDPNWETYEKEYPNFRFVITRHQRTDDIGIYSVIVIDNDDCNAEVVLKEDADEKWIRNLIKLLNL